jgi:hypothetical protein
MSEGGNRTGTGPRARAWPERPGPQGQEADVMSESGNRTGTGPRARAWPERPGPQGQERT